MIWIGCCWQPGIRSASFQPEDPYDWEAAGAAVPKPLAGGEDAKKKYTDEKVVNEG